MEIPDKVWKLFDTKDKWTQGYFAKNSLGEGVTSRDPSAVCFCLTGALLYVHTKSGNYNKYVEAIQTKIGHMNLASWNDHPSRTFEEVKALVTELDI